MWHPGHLSEAGVGGMGVSKATSTTWTLGESEILNREG